MTPEAYGARDRLRGLAAVVVGAGSIAEGWSNGKATAVAFAREGAAVLVVDASRTAAEQTHETILAEGGRSEIFIGDLSQPDPARQMIERCMQVFGAVDVLHNNVGVMVPGGPQELSSEDWDRSFAVNLRTMFLSSKYAVSEMVRRGRGAIVNVGSISGSRFLGMPTLAYSTSKGAVLSMTRALAAQYGPHGVRVNQVTPGIIDTPVLASFADRIAVATGAVPGPAAREARERTVPLRRFGTAWDVAKAAVFLASDEAAYVNGAELVVDGGLACMAPQP